MPQVFRNILFEVCASKLGGLMTPEFQFGLGQIVVAVGTSLAKTHEHPGCAGTSRCHVCRGPGSHVADFLLKL